MPNAPRLLRNPGAHGPLLVRPYMDLKDTRTRTRTFFPGDGDTKITAGDARWRTGNSIAQQAHLRKRAGSTGERTAKRKNRLASCKLPKLGR